VCNETEVVDFVFKCGIQYKPATDGDVAMFDVALAFDGVVDESTIKTTNSSAKTVNFNFAEFPQGQLGTEVNKTIYFKCNFMRKNYKVYNFIISQYRLTQTAVLNAGYCYRRYGAVCFVCFVLVMTVLCENLDEPIEMLFDGQTRIRPRNHVLDGSSM